MRLNLIPSQASYSADFGAQAEFVALEGGPARARATFIGAVARVSVAWNLNPLQADYLMAFYRTGTNYGVTPFTVPLILDGGDVQDYEARFIPGSLKLTGVQGLEVSYSAQLEVKPMDDGANDEPLIMLYGEYEEGAPDILAALAELVNSRLPA